MCEGREDRTWAWGQRAALVSGQQPAVQLWAKPSAGRGWGLPVKFGGRKKIAGSYLCWVKDMKQSLSPSFPQRACWHPETGRT